MSELCCSKGHFYSLLTSYIIHLCSFILSHPLYFAYFIFFSPHILKLVYFLSPLLITISLLLLAFVFEDFSTELSACTSVLEGLRFKKHCPNEEEFRGSDDLGMYEILFGPSVIMEVGENPVEFSEENPEEDPPLVGSSDNEEIKEEDLSTGGEKIESFAADKVVINPVPAAKTAGSNCGAGLMEERRLKNFLKILDEFEKMASGVDERKKVVELPPKSPLRNRSETMETKMSADKKVGVNNGGKDHHRSTARAHSQRISSNVDRHADDEEDAEYKKIATSVEEKRIVEPPPISAEVFEKSPTRNGSGANDSKTSFSSSTNSNGGKDHHKSMVKAHSQRIGSSVYHRGDEDDDAEHKASKNHNNLGNYGSMRKEKEWKRTLACKLFEERHNVDGGEGMDSLWEAYEVNSNNGTTKKTNKKKNENKNKNKKKSEVEEEDDDCEEEGINGQLCCLQALNLSTKKMNLGIGRPNLVKISKAIKGIGWLHHVSKKVHNHGDRY